MDKKITKEDIESYLKVQHALADQAADFQITDMCQGRYELRFWNYQLDEMHQGWFDTEQAVALIALLVNPKEY